LRCTPSKAILTAAHLTDTKTMGSFVNWLGVSLFACGGVATIVAKIFFTVSDPARTRAMFMGVFQTRSDYSAKGWRLYVIGITLAVVGFVLVACAQFGVFGVP